MLTYNFVFSKIVRYATFVKVNPPMVDNTSLTQLSGY